MKAVCKIAKGQKCELRDVKIPEPMPGWVRIKVEYCGICGTDIHIEDDEFATKFPAVIGHEYSGYIEALGEGVTAFQVGDRVVSTTEGITCGTCRYCHEGLMMLCDEQQSTGSTLDGSMAEYVVIPAEQVFRLEDHIDMRVAAMAEPLACCVRNVIESATVNAGDYVYVSGPGTIGQIVAQLAKISGAHVTVAGTAVDTERLAMAKKLGADEIIDVTKENPLDAAKRITKGAMYDVVFECAGAAPSAATCLDVVRKRGHFSQMAIYGKPISFNLDKILNKEVTLASSNASERSSWWIAMRLLEQNKVDLLPLVSNIYPIDDWKTAFLDVRNKIGYKIMIKP